MKTLVIVAHPDLVNSQVNKRWVEELNKYGDQFTVHELYKCYPDGKIDAKKEQALIEEHAGFVLQFPIYWFNCPSLLKEWLDTVFTQGWAFGPAATQLINRKVGLAVSAGIKEKNYKHEGRYHFTLEEILRPFEVVMNYVHADYQPLFSFYGAEQEQGVEYTTSTNDIERSAISYLEHLFTRFSA